MTRRALTLLATGLVFASITQTPGCNSRPSTETPSSARASATSATPGSSVSAQVSAKVPGATMLHRVYFSMEGAPDPLACKADSECIGDTVTRDDGCCVMSSEPLPQTWAWHTWLSNRRMSEACKPMKCPQPPPPSMPPDCSFKVKCVGGVCKNSCTAPG